MTNLMQRVWQRLLRRVGLHGLVGVALLLAAAGLVVWTPRLHDNAARISEDARAKQHAADQAMLKRAELPSTRQLLLQFSTSFPRPSQNAADLKLVFAAAQRHHVELLKGEYQLNSEPNSPFLTYAVTLPVKEGYGEIKAFVADLLRSLPHAAMEELRLERTDIGATLLDARIRINLTYRAY